MTQLGQIRRRRATSAGAESILESVQLSDSMLTSVAHSAFLSDTGQFTDTYTNKMAYPVGLAEGLQVTDLISTGNVFTESLLEGLSLNSIISVTASFSDTLTQGSVSSDLISVKAEITESITENLKFLLDRFNIDHPISIVEPLALSVSNTGGIALSESLIASAQMGDSLPNKLAINISLPENLLAGDVIISGTEMAELLTENLRLSSIMDEVGVVVTLSIRHAFFASRNVNFTSNRNVNFKTMK